jgi:uncharacterized membrane protein YtjA (UPF0391 family)
MTVRTPSPSRSPPSTRRRQACSHCKCEQGADRAAGYCGVPVAGCLAVAFLVIALLAALFGFTDPAAGSAYIARALFLVFLVLFVLAVAFGRRGRRPKATARVPYLPPPDGP